MLAGPPARLRGVVDTFIPSGLSVGLSVPVVDGIAALDLQGDAPQTSPAVAELMLRLSWTFLLNPRGGLDVTDEHAVRDYARRYLAPLVS